MTMSSQHLKNHSYNNVEAIDQSILQYRNSSKVYISGFYFSYAPICLLTIPIIV